MREGRKEFYEWMWKVKESGIIPPGQILEIGTGDHLANYAIFKDKYGFTMSDISEKMVAKHSQTYPNYIHFDGRNILGPGQRDLEGIIACEVLEHCPEPKALISALKGRLKVGGVLVVTTPFWYRIHESTQGDPTITEEDMLDYWRITPSGLRYLFQEAGFVEFYVTGVFKATDYPYTPTHVGGWARNSAIGQEITAFNCAIPDNWIELQVKAEKAIGYEG